MKPWVQWRASGAPGGSRRAKRKHQSCTFFVLLAPRDPFWNPLGTQASPWETSESSFYVRRRHKRHQKGGPKGGSETSAKKEPERDLKWEAFKSLVLWKSSSRADGVRFQRKLHIRKKITKHTQNESRNDSQKRAKRLPWALWGPTFDVFDGAGGGLVLGLIFERP